MSLYYKDLPDSKYYHISQNVNNIISNIDISGYDIYTILKVYKRANKISLLYYPTFDTDPHPPLVKSIHIDLDTGIEKELSYESSNNPPILHRKETFVAPDYPGYEKFRQLTLQEEAAGLYEHPTRIGFKMEWEKLLASKCLTFDDHSLISIEVPKVKFKPYNIERHKTALQRYEPSRPLKSLLENELLSGKSFFDYGCGYGDDIRVLEKLNINASGWDPYFQPEAIKVQSQVVNLGYVLNVIEDPLERIEALKEAFSLCTELLVVSVMHEHQENYNTITPYNDGLITKINTFQKYYKQEEISSYLELTLDTEPMAIGLGLFYVFKAEEAKQDFIARTVRRRLDWTQLRVRERKNREYTPRLSKYEKHQGLFDSFWHICLELGRLPLAGEFEFFDELRRVSGSIPKALEIAQDNFEPSDFERARLSRIDDLLVYFCMTQFRKRIPFIRLSKSLQTDIKQFFGSITDLERTSLDLLMQVGDTTQISEACRTVSFGRLDKDFLQFHSSYVNQLPLLLRIYVGCGSILYGQVKDADVIKIHKSTGKLSLMFYDNFWKKGHPELKLRVKLKLRGQSVDVFEYQANSGSVQLLYEKDSFLDENHPEFHKFSKLTESEMKAGLLRFKGYGPNKDDWEALLAEKGLKVVGHRLLKDNHC